MVSSENIDKPNVWNIL